jgi:hypothetical protein
MPNPTFCVQDFLDIQYRVSYSSSNKKEVLIKWMFKMVDQLLWKDLVELDPQKVMQRSGARIKEGIFEINVLNRTYAVDQCNQKIFRNDITPVGEHDGRLELPLLKYMSGAQPADPSGNWVSPRDLPDGAQFLTGVHSLPVKKIIANFGENRESFYAACQSLGGKPVECADVGFEFTLFPRLPVQVLLWLADDEFPARASMLVDKNADQHLPLDALLSALAFLEYAIVNTIPKK